MREEAGVMCAEFGGMAYFYLAVPRLEIRRVHSTVPTSRLVAPNYLAFIAAALQLLCGETANEKAVAARFHLLGHAR